MDHLILNNGSDSAALAEVALKALREARSSKTSSSGSIFVSDGQTDDDGIALGTGTIINGVDGGIQPWVGDTTPPGKPLGISAESHNGAIWVSWDGTLDGGVPADFDHVQFTAVDGSKTVDMGQLRAAGKVTAAELTAGDTVTITAIAYDDAHDSTGASTPNASAPSVPVSVVVQSAVDAAQVKKAQDDAQSALDKAGQATDTATAAKRASEGAQSTADKAQVAADNAKALANTAQAAAQGAQTTADGKNKIFSAASEPAHTGLVPGDLWFQLDSSSHVTGIQVWNGSAFVDYLIVANEILVAGSVGTTQIKNGAITTDLLTSNAVTAINIAANTITGDKLDVGSVTAAIITSGLFQTSDGLKGFDSSTGYWIKDADGNYLFHVDSDGKVTMSEATIKSVAAGDGVMIGPNVSSTVTGKPWITMDGMAVKFDTSSAVNPTLSGFSHKTESGVSSTMNAISINSGKTTSTSGDGVVYAQSDKNGNSAAGFEVYDSKGNLAAGAWGIEDGHLYLSGFRANGMWSARDYEPAYRVKLSDSCPAKGQQASYHMSYAYPVPFGNRSVIGSAETTALGMVFVPLNMSASGFVAGFYNASGGGRALFLNFIAPWIYGGIKWA